MSSKGYFFLGVTVLLAIVSISIIWQLLTTKYPTHSDVFFMGVEAGVLAVVLLVCLVLIGFFLYRLIVLSKTIKRFKEWFKGYEEAPLWLSFCRLIFAVSTLAFIVLFFGPAILSGDVIGFWMYQHWSLTYVGFPYIAIIVATFLLALIFGIPTFMHEWKRIEELNESKEE